MAEPPSYEETTSTYGYRSDSKSESNAPQRFSIREEVGISRSQHVSALVSKLIPQVRDRAQRGLAKSTWLLLPSDQESSRKGELVGFPQDDTPIIVQLEGRLDTLEFWAQKEAVDDLQRHMLAAVSNELPALVREEPLPQRVIPTKSSFFGRKQAKQLEKLADPPQIRPSLRVEAVLDETHFRAENAFGLYETQRNKCVLLTIEVR